MSDREIIALIKFAFYRYDGHEPTDKQIKLLMSDWREQVEIGISQN